MESATRPWRVIANGVIALCVYYSAVPLVIVTSFGDMMTSREHTQYGLFVVFLKSAT